MKTRESNTRRLSSEDGVLGFGTDLGGDVVERRGVAALNGFQRHSHVVAVQRVARRLRNCPPRYLDAVRKLAIAGINAPWLIQFRE